MKPRVVILGAGFGGLELSTALSEALGTSIDITLIDQADHFIFGFAKLDMLFGRTTEDAERLPYSAFTKPGVRLVRETVTAIDPETRRVTTNAGTHDADYLVIALGADYDVSATPGITLGENEFYTVAGAMHLRDVLPRFKAGHAVIGVCHAPFKCPPAPSECALMLHDYLQDRGVRDACTITLVLPLSAPVPPSPDTSKALVAAFEERGIKLILTRKVTAVRGKTVILDDNTELPCDLFLGVPRNRAPDVVVATGMTQDGWVTIDPRTLETKFPNVWAVGDLANTGAPKAGVFAEKAAAALAKRIVSRVQGEEPTAKNPGAGICYIEFGKGLVARVDADFFSGPAPTGIYTAPSAEVAAFKQSWSAALSKRWFSR
ncbi:MAG TPA: FAD/NAD(P)-binding oxidoreductase [Kofleriaceae bacterium]|jgi:sulfide:quinone oxidoreductase|nr:FAD/NAD(P)-binding oxidoreductase [Kofleriaceae bacterium]